MRLRIWIALLAVVALVLWTSEPAVAWYQDRHEDLPGLPVDGKLIATCVGIVALALLIAVKTHHDDPPEPEAPDAVSEPDTPAADPGAADEEASLLRTASAATHPLPALAPVLTPIQGGVCVGLGMTF